ncbi:MAG: CDP-alcohol phosphatidyltransferase family protein [Clostridia bacterium]|nr:CDP-alcohol phosphatidyltransferase family protein [Clostridia bacterium]
MFIGVYNYTVLLTYLGVTSAVIGMVEAMNGNFRTAILCLLICGLCDMFDGTVARTRKNRTTDEKRFGVQIDSLCDVICFGVFPAIIGLCLCPINVFTVLCSVFFVLAGVIRLAYFNVQEQSREETGDGKREYYLGMPITMSALIMPAVALVTAIDKVSWAYLYPTCLAIVGVLNISRFRVKKPYLVGLLCIAAIGAVVFFLAFRYGGSITCLKGANLGSNV